MSGTWDYTKKNITQVYLNQNLGWDQCHLFLKLQFSTSPVPHGNVQKTPIGSPVLLPGQIACPLCKIGCNDKNVLVGHVSTEHVQYKFMCDELNCSKVYISKSGLFKHKKKLQEVVEETDDSVLCMDCQQTFKLEIDCDNHSCPPQANDKEKKKILTRIKMLK